MNGYNIALLRLILCLNMLPESERVCPGICNVVEYGRELCIVISVPKEHYDRMLDDSDDCYCVLYLDQDFNSCEFYHSHPECIKVMPPRFPISQKVQNQIARVKEWYAKCQKEYKK